MTLVLTKPFFCCDEIVYDVSRRVLIRLVPYTNAIDYVTIKFEIILVRLLEIPNTEAHQSVVGDTKLNSS